MVSGSVKHMPSMTQIMRGYKKKSGEHGGRSIRVTFMFGQEVAYRNSSMRVCVVIHYTPLSTPLHKYTNTSDVQQWTLQNCFVEFGIGSLLYRGKFLGEYSIAHQRFLVLDFFLATLFFNRWNLVRTIP